MKNTRVKSPAAMDTETVQRVTGFFYGIIGVAVVLALGILFLPDMDFLAYSNYLQIIAAICGSLVLLYAWRRSGRKEAFLFAAGGFGLFGIANIAWYVTVFSGQRAIVFPSIIDLGMIASFLILAIAFKKGLPITQINPLLSSVILTICLIIPAGVIAVAGLSASTIITLAYFFCCGAFLMIGMKHSIAKHPQLLIGAVLFAVSFMIYPLREMFLIQNPALSVIGTFVAAGFSLMLTGWLSVR
jgi:hypothetical protein